MALKQAKSQIYEDYITNRFIDSLAKSNRFLGPYIQNLVSILVMSVWKEVRHRNQYLDSYMERLILPHTCHTCILVSICINSRQFCLLVQINTNILLPNGTSKRNGLNLRQTALTRDA